MEHRAEGGGDGGRTHQPPNGASYVDVGIDPYCCRREHRQAVISHQTPNTQGDGDTSEHFHARSDFAQFLCRTKTAAFGQKPPASLHCCQSVSD